MSINIECGKRVRECYEELGMTQKEFAKKIGYSPQHINYIIKGKRPLTPQLAEILGGALNVRPEYLLCKDNLKYKDAKREKDTMHYEKFALIRLLMEHGRYGTLEILESPEHAAGIRGSNGKTLQLMQECIIDSPDDKTYTCPKELMNELCEDVSNYLFMRIEKWLLPKCSEIPREKLIEYEYDAVINLERRNQFVNGVRKILRGLSVEYKAPKYKANDLYNSHEPTEEK